MIKRVHSAGCVGGDCKCKWLLDYRPQGVHGSRRQKLFPTKKAAEHHRDATGVKVRHGEYVDPDEVPTFKEAAEVWFQTKTDRRASHVADLRSRLDKHLLPKLGKQRLDWITPAMIEKLRNGLRVDGYAPRTINTIIRIAGAVFRAAVRRGEAASNPVDRIERAFTAARELQAGDDGVSNDDMVSPDAILNPDEIAKMLDATDTGLYRVLFTTAALTGARSGELFALRWGDVEIPKDGAASIYIRRTVSWARVSGEEIRPRFYPPKTDAGIRKIPLDTDLAAVLRVWKIQCPASLGDLVFPAPDGRPIRRSNALRYGLWPALRRAELRRVNMHSLRHSFASALIMGGAAVTEVQSLLGHASAAITLRIYSHWFKTADSGAVGRLSQRILGKVDASSGSEGKWMESGWKKPSVAAQNPVSA